MEFRSDSLDGTKMILSGELTIGRVLETREELLSRLWVHAATEIDLREATGIDPAFLQLLCSAHRTAVGLGRSLSVLGLRTPLLLQQLSDSGFVRHAGCTLDCRHSCIWVGAEGCP